MRIIGEHPFAGSPNEASASQIATAFPSANVLVTLPGIHATQRVAYLDILDAERGQTDRPGMTEEEQGVVMDQAVDLIVERGVLLIRPDPDRMDLAYAADEMLQELFPKRKIKFLHVLNDKVRGAIQRRGEVWRIYPLPKSAEEIEGMIRLSRMAISGRPIYYFNAATGTRWLTYQDFAALGQLGDEELRQHIREIAQYGILCNKRGRPEIAFFMAKGGFGVADFSAAAVDLLDAGALRMAFEQLRARFYDAVVPEFRRDDPAQATWRNRMYCVLIGDRDDVVLEEDSLLGLGSEFFMQIQWLPGARLEDGELIFDSVFDEPASDEDRALGAPCDDKVRSLICNLIQDYGDLMHVNIGRVFGSPNPSASPLGRRDVYIAQIMPRGSRYEILQIIRMQKWGVSERLDEGKDLLRAMMETEEYTEYILDRRLGCRQLGMNLLPRISTRKLSERYSGRQKGLEGITIWSPYFQRDYIPGISSNRIPAGKLQDAGYAGALAGLLGRAAAPNMIVGRADPAGNVIFDVGDEIIVERGLPVSIVIADLTGTFNNFRSDLREIAPAYAGPLNRRRAFFTDPRAIAEAYIGGFSQRFVEIQQEYRKRKRAFDRLFSHRPSNPQGNFAFRWECILERLNRANVLELAQLIRGNLTA